MPEAYTSLAFGPDAGQLQVQQLLLLLLLPGAATSCCCCCC
jgi:hypothetical protein